MKYLSIFLYILLFVVLSGEVDYEKKSEDQLNKYLAGSAEYCKKLKGEAFHFYCKEKILFERDEFVLGSTRRGNLKRRRSSTKSYFDYQLIQEGGKLKERRRRISDKVADVEMDPSELLLSFLSEKAVFGPNSILDQARQSNFNYKIFKNKKTKENDIVIIKAIPKIPGRTFFLAAEVYIDKKNFSVRKIVATPVFIKGYENMKRTASYFKTRLFLDCEILFDQSYKGLFFPTLITITEKYKGGPVVNRNTRSKEWVKSKTTFKYYEYRFFDVDTEVKVQD